MHNGARITGLVTFVVGLALLAIAFTAAWRLLQDARVAAVPGTIQSIPSALIPIIAQGLFLFVMGAIGSLIAARGIQLYESGSRHKNREAPSPKAVADDAEE